MLMKRSLLVELAKQREKCTMETKTADAEASLSEPIRMAQVKSRPGMCYYLYGNTVNLETLILLDASSENGLIRSEHPALDRKAMEAAGDKFVTIDKNPV